MSKVSTAVAKVSRAAAAAPAKVSQAVTDRLIDDWKSAWKMFSIWCFAFVAALPEIYEAVVAMDWLNDEAVPQSLRWTLRLAGVGGIVLRLWKQQTEVLKKQYEQLEASEDQKQA